MPEDPDAGRPPTEAEVQADQELAAQIVAASVLAPLNFLGSGGAVLATIATPIAARIASFVVTRLSERRVSHAAETVLDAAQAAELPFEDFIDRAQSDDRRHELLARTLFIAQDAAWRGKRRALSRALAAGVMGDDARIDEELLFVRAVEGIHEMDVRLLSRFADGSQLTEAFIARTDPGLAHGLLPLLGNLQSHGLIDSRSPVTPGGAMTPEPQYFITTSGRDFLDRLSDDDA